MRQRVVSSNLPSPIKNVIENKKKCATYFCERPVIRGWGRNQSYCWKHVKDKEQTIFKENGTLFTYREWVAIKYPEIMLGEL